jgi:hypothetical protein
VSNHARSPLRRDETSAHRLAALGIEALMMASLQRKTLDNVTVVMVAFRNFEGATQEQGANGTFK